MGAQRRWEPKGDGSPMEMGPMEMEMDPPLTVGAPPRKATRSVGRKPPEAPRMRSEVLSIEGLRVPEPCLMVDDRNPA